MILVDLSGGSHCQKIWTGNKYACKAPFTNKAVFLDKQVGRNPYSQLAFNFLFSSSWMRYFKSVTWPAECGSTCGFCPRKDSLVLISFVVGKRKLSAYRTERGRRWKKPFWTLCRQVSIFPWGWYLDPRAWEYLPKIWINFSCQTKHSTFKNAW